MPRSFLSKIVAVFGQPVAENPTQAMLEAAFHALRLPWRYLTLEVAPDALPQAVIGMRAMGFAGANCTIPHKIAVIPLLDEVTPSALRIGAVNTIVRRPDESLLGENTDGKGFLSSVIGACAEIRGTSVMLLGAGGAARAIAIELGLAGARRIDVVNRSSDRGSALVAHIEAQTRATGRLITWCEGIPVPAETQLVVNATSIGLYPDVAACPPLDFGTLSANALVCDVIPNPPDTPFLRAARAAGAQTLDGLGMLVEQGAIGFKLWTGEEAPIQAMRQALEEVFSEDLCPREESAS
jgi:shikimate dehydrogenase